MSAITKKPDGTLIVTVRLTLKSGRDDDLIAIVTSARRGTLAATIREAMRSGVTSGAGIEAEVVEVDTSGLGFDL
jgi:hypothetical protein